MLSDSMPVDSIVNVVSNITEVAKFIIWSAPRNVSYILWMRHSELCKMGTSNNERKYIDKQLDS